MRFDMIRPCANCPWRTDTTLFLRPERVKEILEAVVNGGNTFACHETTRDSWEETDEGAVYSPQPDEQHCAGALILLKKLRIPHHMTRLAQRLGIYDPSRLDMGAPVFETPGAMLRYMRAIDRKEQKDRSTHEND